MNNFVSQDSRIERLFANIDQNLEEEELSQQPLFFTYARNKNTGRSERTESSADSCATPVVSTFHQSFD